MPRTRRTGRQNSCPRLESLAARAGVELAPGDERESLEGKPPIEATKEGRRSLALRRPSFSLNSFRGSIEGAPTILLKSFLSIENAGSTISVRHTHPAENLHQTILLTMKPRG